MSCEHGQQRLINIHVLNIMLLHPSQPRQQIKNANGCSHGMLGISKGGLRRWWNEDWFCRLGWCEVAGIPRKGKPTL